MKKLFITLLVLFLALPVLSKEIRVFYNCDNQIIRIGDFDLTYANGKITKISRSGSYFDKDGNWHTYKPMKVLYNCDHQIIRVGDFDLTYANGRITKISRSGSYFDKDGNWHTYKPIKVFYNCDNQILYIGNIECNYIDGKLYSIVVPDNKPDITYPSS